MSEVIAGIQIPDTSIVRAATELVRDTENDLLYNHSRRVFLWGALSGNRRGLHYDPELLYVGAMFHDMGLTAAYASPDLRFEVDGANAARDFLQAYDVSERDVDDVWNAIALHTTPGIPAHMRPTVALVTAGVEMDVWELIIISVQQSSVSRYALVIHGKKILSRGLLTSLSKAPAINRKPPLVM